LGDALGVGARLDATVTKRGNLIAFMLALIIWAVLVIALIAVVTM
jgi:hypothetical protein